MSSAHRINYALKMHSLNECREKTTWRRKKQRHQATERNRDTVKAKLTSDECEQMKEPRLAERLLPKVSVCLNLNPELFSPHPKLSTVM